MQDVHVHRGFIGRGVQRGERERQAGVHKRRDPRVGRLRITRFGYFGNDGENLSHHGIDQCDPGTEG